MPIVLLLLKPITPARSQQENKRSGFVCLGRTTARNHTEHKPAGIDMVHEAAQLSGHFTQQHTGCVAVLLQGNQPLWVLNVTQPGINMSKQRWSQSSRQRVSVGRESSYRCITVATVFPGTLLSRRGDGDSCCCADHQPEACGLSGTCEHHSWSEMKKEVCTLPESLGIIS